MTPDDLAAHYEAQTGVIELDHSWPGLDAPSQVSEVDTDVLLGFAHSLELEVDRVTEPDAPLSRLTTATGEDWPFGIWETGAQLHRRLVDARFYLLEVQADLVTELRNAIWLVRREVIDVLGDEEAARHGLEVHDPGPAGPLAGPAGPVAGPAGPLAGPAGIGAAEVADPAGGGAAGAP